MEVHPDSFVTVNEYVPADRSVMSVVGPDPGIVAPLCDIVTIHDPDDGSPLSAMLPPGSAHVGCVIVPITGAVGMGGRAFITNRELGADIQSSLLVT